LVIDRLYDRAYTSQTEDGLRILIEEDPQSRSVSAGVWAAIGSRHDPASRPGLAHFIEHLAFKGTKTRSAAQISEEIDSVGGNLNAATGRESTVFYADVPAEGLETALDLLSDLVLHPAFAQDKVKLERAVVLDEISGHEDDPESVAFDRFIAGVWDEGHPLSRPVLGSKEGIEAATARDVRAQHNRMFRPSRTIIAAAGAVTADAFVDAVRARFPSQKTPPAAPSTTSPPHFSSGRRHHERPTSQTHIYLALPGPNAGDPDRYELEVANVALGDGTSSRLFRAIREERGLAYTVGSTLMRYTDGGIWMLYAASSSSLAGKVRTLLEREVTRLRDEPPSDDEVALAKARLRGLYILSMESNANRSMRLGNAAIVGREIHSHDEVLEKLDRVTTSAVHDVIDRFVRPEALHVTTVGKRTDG
jgi:predicted Zn-dependent peptidase